MADVIEFVPDRSQFCWTFGGVEPVLKISPGTVLRLWTEDAFGGRLREKADRSVEKLGDLVNPQTGPFYVTGAEPGDTLVLHVTELTPARDWGVSAAVPFFGGLTSTAKTPSLQAPLPDMTWIYEVDRQANTARFTALRGEFSWDLPLAPMLGTVGVAPAGEVRTTMVADAFGGNMDTPELRAGATCYLGVNVPGALFSVGDGHYRQGEGEACGTAIEGAMNVTLLVDLIKGGAPRWPRVERDDALVVVGSARPLEDAWRIAQLDMVRWLSELYGLDEMDSYQLLSQTSEAPLANVVDTNYTAIAKVSKSLLPAADAFGGMHRRIRSLAASL